MHCASASMLRFFDKDSAITYLFFTSTSIITLYISYFSYFINTFDLVTSLPMNAFNNKIDFATLLSLADSRLLLQRLTMLTDSGKEMSTGLSALEKEVQPEMFKIEWQKLSAFKANNNTQQSIDSNEQATTDWLIKIFNNLFASQQVVLARSKGEPEYFPAKNNKPARIEFAHGFFASALHEISHWCVAGEERRGLSDFGYWYAHAPDGRTAAQQQDFERVEIKPQALECLFTLACGRSFQVSQDNLFANFDTSNSTFEKDVYHQVEKYIAKPSTLPRDAKTLLRTLIKVCMSD